ncbi:MAG: hypothetical protein ABSF71_00740 [Terriglobia bacterium]
MSLKLHKLINFQGQDKAENGHIKNEGISRDVTENKWGEYSQNPVPRDVDENK